MRGVYRYWCDGAPQEIIEPWELQREDDGWRLTGQRIIKGATALDVEAQYLRARCTEMRVSWLASTPMHHADLIAPDDALLFPLLRVAAGPLLPLLTEGPRTVLVPNLRDPSSADFLKPLRSTRHAALLDERAHHYRYYGGEYGEAGADYWLDDHSLVARYLWVSPRGAWEVRLEDLSLAAEFSGFASNA